MPKRKKGQRPKPRLEDARALKPSPGEKHGLTYASRDQVLSGMGYESYSEYLKSQHWDLIRRLVYI